MYLGSTYLRNLVETYSPLVFKIQSEKTLKSHRKWMSFQSYLDWILKMRGVIGLDRNLNPENIPFTLPVGSGGPGGGYIIPTVPISYVGPELSSQFHAWSSHRNSYPAVLSSTSLLFWHLFHLSLCSFAKTISHCSFLLLHTFSPSKE